MRVNDIPAHCSGSCSFQYLEGSTPWVHSVWYFLGMIHDLALRWSWTLDSEWFVRGHVPGDRWIEDESVHRMDVEWCSRKYIVLANLNDVVMIWNGDKWIFDDLKCFILFVSCFEIFFILIFFHIFIDSWSLLTSLRKFKTGATCYNNTCTCPIFESAFNFLNFERGR